MPCETCHNEARIAALEKDSERNQLTHREFYERFEKLKISNAVSDERYNNILSTLSDVKNKVDELAAKPAKRWDSLVMQIISLVAAGVVGSFITAAMNGGF